MKQLEILAIRLDSPLTTVNPMVLEHISTLRPYTRQLNLLAWLKTDATRDLATTKSRSMAQTPEQQRGTLFARLRMELTLFSLSLFVPRALASPGSTGLRPSLPRSRQPLGRGRAVEFKPARPTRSETVSLLALQRGVSVRGEGRGVSD